MQAISGHVQTDWGQHTLSQATRRLLQTALENPLNARFVLLCGSSLPVRPARFTYSQLIGEGRSHFDEFVFSSEDEVSSLLAYNMSWLDISQYTSPALSVMARVDVGPLYASSDL